jgi:hypothetical protein
LRNAADPPYVVEEESAHLGEDDNNGDDDDDDDDDDDNGENSSPSDAPTELLISIDYAKVTVMTIKRWKTLTEQLRPARSVAASFPPVQIYPPPAGQ